MQIGRNTIDHELFPDVAIVRFENKKLEVKLEDNQNKMGQIKYTGLFIECLIETKLGDKMHVTSPMFVAPDDYSLLKIISFALK